MTRQPLWVILCRLPESGRKEIEEIVKEMKERDREQRNRNEVKKQKNKKIPQVPYLLQWTPRWRKIHDTFATPAQPLK